MTSRQAAEQFGEALFDTDRERALQVIGAAVAEGLAPEEIVFEVIVPVLDGKIKTGGVGSELNLAQHFLTSQIAAEVTEKMIPLFRTTPECVGRVVIGTAYGDLHTLGKRIVIGCLGARMIESTDLGVNVPAEKFVDEAVARNAQVIGISAMMAHTARGEHGCLKVRQLLKARGLEGRIRVIVGGAPFRFDRNLYRTVQADSWADDGVLAGKVITELIREVKSI